MLIKAHTCVDHDHFWILELDKFIKCQEVNVIGTVDGLWQTKQMMGCRNTSTQYRIVFNIINAISSKNNTM